MKTRRNLRSIREARPVAAKDIIGLHQPVIEEKSAIPVTEFKMPESNQDPQPINDWVPCPWIERLILAREHNSKGINH